MHAIMIVLAHNTRVDNTNGRMVGGTSVRSVLAMEIVNMNTQKEKQLWKNNLFLRNGEIQYKTKSIE